MDSAGYRRVARLDKLIVVVDELDNGVKALRGSLTTWRDFEEREAPEIDVAESLQHRLRTLRATSEMIEIRISALLRAARATVTMLEDVDSRTLRDLASALRARAEAKEAADLTARRSLSPAGVDRLAEILAAGDRPTIGFWHRYGRRVDATSAS